MNEETNNNLEQELDLNQLMIIRREKLEKLKQNNKNPFEITKFDITHTSKEIIDNYEELEGKDVTIAGRIMAKRIMGKASFCHIQDGDGKIQSYVSINDLGEESYKQFKEDDIGDIIGITGFVFKTRTGEISIHAKEVILLSKSLRPLPEKFHGLKDTDLRYRQRSVDLIMNPEVKETFKKRSLIIKEIRNMLDEKGFMEVETPILQTIPGGASARPFITHHNTLDIDMYLRIATELYLKRLIVGGFDKVYEIGRNFRNEGMDIKHNPEFTCIELYEAYTNLEGMMNITEELIRRCANKVCGTGKISYQGEEIDLEKPFRRITMIDSIKEVTGVDFNTVETDEEAQKIAKDLNMEIDPIKTTRGDIIVQVFEEKVEETIIRCHKMTDEIQNIVSYIENEKKIMGYKRGTTYPLNINSIYYFEIVDQNAFVYCEKEIYESKMKLYEFEQETEGTSFFRASKSLIINADKIDSIKPSLSGRFEVVLKNKEKLIVSRQYVRVLKHMIGL